MDGASEKPLHKLWLKMLFLATTYYKNLHPNVQLLNGMLALRMTRIEKGVTDFLTQHVIERIICKKLETDEDYYKVLEVDYDASDDNIKLSYRKLALKWHPDKHKGEDDVTAKFQEINEAYKVLSDPVTRLEYDFSGCYEVNRYTAREYLTRFKGMILTCNGLGIDHSSKWARHLREWDPH